ncbi:uncharacterized protein LOC111707598 [Eurytemora carolleeae]|uniref:uncharacterized protein LOC111707598 n=1 Tax=Eurytemora carolleeae TaxID=1294199 RepID=UPI000C760F15|nr:uncharacterized protein LOC111707598 [Eurytemora carolleeae]|eukprot:XP_023336499.1 uncharacterized protein LOC111707598 [Eurytemora affinis]
MDNIAGVGCFQNSWADRLATGTKYCYCDTDRCNHDPNKLEEKTQIELNLLHESDSLSLTRYDHQDQAGDQDQAGHMLDQLYSHAGQPVLNTLFFNIIFICDIIGLILIN